MSACYCGNARPYTACCGRLHSGGEIAATAEALMRSRYSAYVLRLEAYLLATWHPTTRPQALDLAEDDGVRWLGLDVRRRVPADENHATVEFVARYRINGRTPGALPSGRGHRLHEISRFVHEGGRWYYLDGEQVSKDAPAR